jgi:NMD protein affecting ribosome stability and mRNA decay
MEHHPHPDLLDDELSRPTGGPEIGAGSLPLLCPACFAGVQNVVLFPDGSLFTAGCSHCGACW